MSSPRQYYVYVIELADAAGPRRRADRPVVYVGQSAFPPEERFAQHLAGYRSSRYVRDHGIRLRPRLYRAHNPIASRELAETMEVELGRRLEKRGYTVRGAH